MQFPFELLSLSPEGCYPEGRCPPPVMASSTGACFIFPLKLVWIQLTREGLLAPGISTARNIFREGAQAFRVRFFLHL